MVPTEFWVLTMTVDRTRANRSLRWAAMKWLPAGMLALLAAGLVAVPAAALFDVPGERRVKELVGINPDGCEVRNEGDGSDWREEAAMPSLRDGPAPATIGTSVYLLGGIASFSEDFDRARSVATFERFDVRTGRWTELPPLPRPLNHVGLAAVGRTLYALGGNTDRLRAGQASAESWRFDTSVGRWEPIAAMPTARGGAGTAVVGDRIYVIGGKSGPTSLSANESYDTGTGEWSRHADMPTRRDHLGVAAAGGRLYAVGGRKEDEESLRTLEVYDPATDGWSEGAALPEPKAGFAFLPGPGGLIAAGGEDLSRWTLYGGVYRLRVADGRWETLPAMAEPRHGFGAAVVEDRLYVMGGSRCSGFLPDHDSASMPLA
jgi:hypothetical protein